MTCGRVRALRGRGEARSPASFPCLGRVLEKMADRFAEGRAAWLAGDEGLVAELPRRSARRVIWVDLPTPRPFEGDEVGLSETFFGRNLRNTKLAQ